MTCIYLYHEAKKKNQLRMMSNNSILEKIIESQKKI